jgi:hypothetical protein
MKIHKMLNTILMATTLCGMGTVFVSCMRGHPYPLGEIYEIRDPKSNRTVVRIQNTQWTDGRTGPNFGTLKFRQPDGSVVRIELRFDNDPNYWTVWYCSQDEEIQEIGVNRIYGPSVPPRNFFDKCWVEDGESFDE